MAAYKVTVELEARDVSMILAHLHQSRRDGWYYGQLRHFANRRDRLVELFESKLPTDPQP